MEAAREKGSIIIEQIDAAELSPGEFAHRVRRPSNSQRAKTVVIDSLNGYQAAMPEENSLILHMHELLQYLNRQGATTFLTVAQHGLVGDMQTPVDVTYLADTVILLRYFEALGQVRRAVSVIKKRSGSHKSTIREFRIGNRGVIIGEPLTKFHGVLRGVPTYSGSQKTLLEGKGKSFRPSFGACNHSRAERARCGGRSADSSKKQAFSPIFAVICLGCARSSLREPGSVLLLMKRPAVPILDRSPTIWGGSRPGPTSQ